MAGTGLCSQHPWVIGELVCALQLMTSSTLIKRSPRLLAGQSLWLGSVLVWMQFALVALLGYGSEDMSRSPPWSPQAHSGVVFGVSGNSVAFQWIALIAGLMMVGVVLLHLRTRSRHAQEVAELHGRTRLALASIERERKEAALLDEIIQRINAGLDLQEILNFVFESFEPLMPYDRIGFALIENNGATVRSHWSRSKRGELRLGIGYVGNLANSSLEAVFRMGVPRVLNDLERHFTEHPQSESTRLMLAEGMRSSLTCPLIANGKPVGFLFFSSSAPHAYQPVHVERFMRVAMRLSLIVEKGRCYEETARAHARLAGLLDGLIPPAVHSRLVPGGESHVADSFADVTVMFADLVRFSEWSACMAPERVVELLNRIFSRFDRMVSRFALQKVGTQGDSYLVVAGAPVHRINHAEAAAALSLAIQRTLAWFRQTEKLPITARIGIHTGPVVAGIIGRTVHRYDIWGQTVNLASRLESTAEPGTIQVSDETRKRLTSRFELEERGLIKLKGFGLKRTHWLLGRHDRSRTRAERVCVITSSQTCACRQSVP